MPSYTYESAGNRNPNLIPLQPNVNKFPVKQFETNSDLTLYREFNANDHVDQPFVGAATHTISLMCVTATVFSRANFISAEVPIFVDSGFIESYIT